jgi:hypothetical protein
MGENLEQMNISRRARLLVGLFAYIALSGCITLLGCGGSSDNSMSVIKSSGVASQGGQPSPQIKGSAVTYPTRPVHWKIFGPPQERSVRISAVVGYCAGDVMPRIQSVRVREDREKILITAMQTIPTSNGKGCAGIGFGLHKTLRLRRPLGRRKLYDASTSPPKKRWPVG